MFNKTLPSNARVAHKKNSIQMVVQTNFARRILEKVIEVDDKIQEIATETIEITPDNIVSKGIRKLFGIKLPMEAPSVVRDKTAKSKWHEILKRAENIDSAEEKAIRARRMEQRALAMSMADHSDVVEDVVAMHPETFDIFEELKNHLPPDTRLSVGRK